MKIKDEIIKDYESIHGLAEVGFDLPRTIEYVKSRLCDMSIEHEELGGGIVGYIGQRRDGCTLLRADMDALPIKEKTGLPFSAEGDAMQQNMHLQREITAARELYNDTVAAWNRDIFAWPTKQIVAARAGYTTRIPFIASKEIKAQAKDVFF